MKSDDLMFDKQRLQAFFKSDCKYSDDVSDIFNSDKYREELERFLLNQFNDIEPDSDFDQSDLDDILVKINCEIREAGTKACF